MQTEAVLSQAQIDEFAENGILTVDFGLDAHLLDRIVTATWLLYDEPVRQGYVPGARIQDAWKTVDEVRQLAVESRIQAALAQLFGRKPLPFQTLNFPAGTGQLAHSDTIHFSTIPEGFMAGVWVALEDIDEDNGPLVYYPGSQRLPYYDMQDFDLAPGYDNYHLYEQRIQDLIRQHRLEAVQGIVKKGDAIIWHANVLHGGMPQKDPGRSRHSQVTHYYFEGCQYYTPMDSTPERMAWRHPFWIPQTAEFTLPGQEMPRRGLLRRIAAAAKRRLL